MDGPIVPALAIFARAVERVDDPDAALTAAGRVVLFFFGQQRIGGARGEDFVGGFDPFVGLGVFVVRRDECGDRKSVVEGKSVSVRVDLGGRRIITKKTIIFDPTCLVLTIRYTTENEVSTQEVITILEVNGDCAAEARCQ